MNAKIKGFLKRSPFLIWIKSILPKLRYIHYFKKLKINDKAILLESEHGSKTDGNIFYILKYLTSSEKYADYSIYISCRQGNAEQLLTLFDNYGIKGVIPVVVSSFEYMKILASAKYLINDTTFMPYFIKKEGQVYLNTWHGTPLKTLGKKVNNARSEIGNVQKNFIVSDYLLYPNKYTMEHMVEDYMLENLTDAKALLAGYPRNTVFFNGNRGKEIAKELEIQDKKIYAYMPTWRGNLNKPDAKANAYFQYYLYELDGLLSDDEILYLNLHPLAKKNVDFDTFKHIRNFPSEYETYDFLNCAQCLVTDYSSVFYDFAVTGKKTVIFAFDEEEYFADRGVYKPLSSLPFTKVKTVKALVDEMRKPKNYDDSAFLKEYCEYDSPKATEDVIDYVILGKESENVTAVDIPKNGKKNVLLYLGNMDQNGLTTSAMNLLNNLDLNECNYFVSFSAKRSKMHGDTIAALPERVGYIPIQGKSNFNLIQKKVWIDYLRKKVPFFVMNAFLKNAWKYEIKRIFGGAHFDSAIQFTGYETKMIMLFSKFDCNTGIYVHNDMVKEIETRGNQRKSLLKYAYKTYDNVALVTEDLLEPTSTFVKDTNNFKYAHNVIARDEILRKGDLKLKFDEGVTRSTKSLEELKKILESDSKVIVSVGRFSPEKGHKRMIDAFNEVWENNKDTYFIIIGGNQRDGLYDELCEYIKTLPCGNNTVLILSMQNPMPLVKACDGFILGSFYEGFGLVLVEADILGLPVVSTDITGPRLFMQKHKGTLVDNSKDGIKKGFEMLLSGKVQKLSVDYDEYNRQAVEEFKSVLN